MIKRRTFIAGLGGTVAAWPIAVRAQQAAMPVIGFLSSQSAEIDYKEVTVPFLQGLKDTGYVEGRNVAIEYRYAENQYDRLPALAADLVHLRVAVILATGAPPQRWRQSERPRQYQSSLPPALTRSQWVLSVASTGPERTSPAAPI